ncbi:hypothetical protein [Actinomyces sp. zg296]|uniref:hypothetical protein n=1 Tax=Actinomyces sp. zg296 TaxID=2609289 RepID=UPI00135CAFBB|nr:hypothetical protein [Actinomyces sp. zg296]
MHHDDYARDRLYRLLALIVTGIAIMFMGQLVLKEASSVSNFFSGSREPGAVVAYETAAPNYADTERTTAVDPGPTNGGANSKALTGGVRMMLVVVGGVIVMAIGAPVAYHTFSKALERRRQVRADKHRAAAALVERREQWSAVEKRHQVVQDAWFDAEMDVVTTMLTRPALLDPAVPATGRLIEALENARAIHAASGGEPPAAWLDGISDLESLPYYRAVLDLERNWRAATTAADKAGRAILPRTERRILAEVESLLAIATGGASANERDTAYARIKTLLGRIKTLRIPEKAWQAIDAAHRPQIAAGVST